MEQARKPTIKRGSKAYIYHVESKSRPGTFHVVDAYRLTCSCPAGRKERGCWHLRLCLGYHDWRKAQQDQAKAASWGSAPARATGIQALAEAFA